jgi:hypothetical protein
MHSDTLFGTLVVSCIETTKLQYPNLYFVPVITVFWLLTDFVYLYTFCFDFPFVRLFGVW